MSEDRERLVEELREYLDTGRPRLCRCITAALSLLDERARRIEELEQKFGHTWLDWGHGDICGRCNMDIRDPIHFGGKRNV